MRCIAKKFISVLLTAAMLLPTMNLPAIASDVESNINQTHTSLLSQQELIWNLAADGTLTISGNGKIGVNELKYRDDMSSEDVKVLIIEDGITSIEDYAFSGCVNMTSVSLPDTITIIRSGAFEKCTSLESVTIPGSVETVEGSAFKGCTSLSAVNIMEGVKTLEYGVFRDCTNLESVIVPKSVTNVNGAFAGNTKLKSAGPVGGQYNYQFSWTAEIPDGAFQSCTNLTEVTIPETVTTIGSGAFGGCENLTDVTLPAGVTTICSSAFSGCTKLADINIPEGVTSIEADTFSFCGNLTEVLIPDGVTTIGFNAFSYCTSLAAITVPDSVTVIGSHAFDGCTSLVTVGNLGKITLIDRGTFQSCTSLKEITIPSTVECIGVFAFKDCSALEEITIPYGVNTIDRDAFRNSGIKQIELPQSVTDIAEYAFATCKNLTSATIPDSIVDIGENLFISCISLAEVNLPDNLTSISSSMFFGCTSLENVTIPSSVTTIGSSAFERCSSIKEIIIPDGVATIPSLAFSDCTALEYVTIPDTVTSIGNWAFSGCESLKEIIIPDSVESIGKSAFSDVHPDFVLFCFPASCAENYAIENEIPFQYVGFSISELELAVTDSAGNTVEGDMTINWYEKGTDTIIGTGKTLHNYDENKQYQFEVIPGEQLSYIYYQPERQDVVVDETGKTTSLVLNKIENVTVAGKAVDENGSPVANSHITIRQIFNKKYEKETTATADENGNFSFDIPNVPTDITVSANGYYSENIVAIANRLTQTENALGNISLQKLPKNKITLSISKTAVKTSDLDPLKTSVTSTSGIQFTLKNITTNTDITKYEVQFPDIIIDNSFVNGGDIVEITAIDTKGNMTAAPVNVTLDAQKMGSCNIEFIQNGYIEVTDIKGNPENYVFVFDSKGKYVDTYSATREFKSNNLPGGEYKLIFIKKTTLLRSINSTDKLDKFGLSKDIDYIEKNITVIPGKVSTLEGVIVPVLDEQKLYFTVKENTGVSVNCSTIAAGRYFVIRAEYKIDDKYNSESETITVELPEGINFAQGSLTLNGKIASYSSDNNTITVNTNAPEGVIRFYALSTQSGKYDINGYLSFINDGTEIMQPIGTATVTIESAKIVSSLETGSTRTTVRGTSPRESIIKVYDNDVLVGTTTTNKAGSWALTFDLVSPGTYSYHYIYATIETEGYDLITTDEVRLVYDKSCVVVSKITMINQAHPADNMSLVEYSTVFDFINPTPVQPYRYWPEYPDFTFKVEFANGWNNLENVYVLTELNDGSTVYVPTVYDDISKTWIGTYSYKNSVIPTSVGVTWDYKSADLETYGQGISTNDYFKDIIADIKQKENTEQLIEDEDKKENPDFDHFTESGNQLTPEEEAVLRAKYSAMSAKQLELEFDELVAMCDADASGMDEYLNELDSYSTDYSTTSETETGDIIDYTMTTCDGINEQELEADGYTKFTDAEGNSYYTKSTDTLYSYVNFNENVYMVIDLTKAVDTLSVEMLSDDVVQKWRDVAENVLGWIDNVKRFIDSCELRMKDNITKALNQFNKYEKRVNDIKLLISVYESNPDVNTEKLHKELRRLQKDKALYFSRVKRFDNVYKKFLKITKVSPIFQYITMAESISLNLIKYCDLYDSTIPCENDPADAEAIRNQLITSAQIMVAFCIGTGVIFIACINPATMWGGFVAMAAEYAVAKATDRVIKNNIATFIKKISELECEEPDPDPDPVPNPNPDPGPGGGGGGGSFGGGSGQQNSPSILDPSGYVYEAVPSNRVEGVNAQCYYYDYPIDDFGMPGESKEEILWIAEEYDQVNPLITDKNGMYAWDVPMGEWLVKFSKEGYYDTDSKNDIAANENGYLPVPPPQTEVNTAIVSKVAPKVESINVYTNEIQIIFSQYMQIDSVNTSNVKITSGGKTITGAISPENAEYDYNEQNQYASIFKFVPDEALQGSADVEISNVKNYAGKSIEQKSSHTSQVSVKPESISVSANVNVPYNSGALVEIEIFPKEAGANKTLTVSTSSPSIVGVVNNVVTTDENAKATVMLNGNLPGEGEITIFLDGTDIKASSKAKVGNIIADSNACAKVSANIQSGSTVQKDTQLTLSTETDGAEIYYTLDGTCPCVINSPSRIKYTGPVTINEDMFIIAYAVKEGLDDSSTAGFVYTVAKVLEKVETPVANPKGSQVESGTTISLSTSTDNATIYYTTNGNTPTDKSTVYSVPISVTSDVTIKAIAVKQGMTQSDVMSESYTIKTGGGGGGGGSSKPSSGGVIVAPAIPQSDMKFKDVKDGAWYYDAVKFVFEKGITNGVSETSYQPDGKVTRGQFITMLMRAYDIPEMTGDNFDDCGNTWYTGYLAAAKQLGISNGVGNNKFAPEKEITREEMVTLIYNYLKSKNEITEQNSKTSFADNDSISEWAKSAVSFATAKGYVKGKENNMFDPKGKATRAELAQIFYNIFAF